MKTIILCADDYGQNESISQAIIALLEKKRLSATSCMTTAHDWQNHSKLLIEFKNKVDIGLHFNLTEGKPLSGTMAKMMPLGKLVMRSYWRFLDASIIEAELNAQLDAFSSAMGQLPDFIDGHQHVHQLPVVRNAIFKVYEQRLRQQGCYIRCVNEERSFLGLSHRPYIKKLAIQLLGAGRFKKELVKRRIPHNTSFSGIYSFAESKKYPAIFRRFLAKIGERGIIMCHPGIKGEKSADVIAAARFDEFKYFESERFVADCKAAEVVLGRFK